MGQLPTSQNLMEFTDLKPDRNIRSNLVPPRFLCQLPLYPYHSSALPSLVFSSSLRYKVNSLRADLILFCGVSHSQYMFVKKLNK